MKNQLKAFIKQCDVCQHNKASHSKPAGLLQPLPIPEQIWEAISMDFVDGLPFSQGFSAIFVVVDRLSKYDNFTAIKHHYTAPQVAQIFFTNIFFVFMVCLPPSFVTGTRLLRVLFGKHFSSSTAPSSTLALPTTPKRMVKRKL